MALILLVALAPLICAIILLQLAVYKSEVFFFQERSGLNGDTFNLIKFRTMLDKRSLSGQQLPDKDRITFLGKILRFTSLDELPNLINVLKNDMSFIGPRPFPSSYFKLMSNEQKRRYSVRPGITGLAQTKGRNNLTWKTKILYDLEYIENINILSDFLISLKTLIFLFSYKKNETLGDQSIDDFTPNFDQ